MRKLSYSKLEQEYYHLQLRRDELVESLRQATEQIKILQGTIPSDPRNQCLAFLNYLHKFMLDGYADKTFMRKQMLNRIRDFFIRQRFIQYEDFTIDPLFSSKEIVYDEGDR